MKVVIAIDSFKGSLSSIEAGEAIKKGILSVCDANVVIKPLADGGEGTVEALSYGRDGRIKVIDATGPLYEKRKCAYGQLPDRKTAVIEISAAAGLTLVPDKDKNPLDTTTYGVGEIIKDAIGDGYRNFIIGLGGSATNDCGIGMLAALGFEFYDKNHKLAGTSGKSVGEIEYIETSHALPELRLCNFRIACDVNNPLYGENGATRIYGPQKGATPGIAASLDQGLEHFSNRVRDILKLDNALVPGVGAAGGLGYAFLTFLNASLESGINIVLEEIHLDQEIADADFIITGEGRLDFQSVMGKAPIGVAKLAKKYGKIVLGFAGSTAKDATVCNDEGIDAYFDIIHSVTTIEDAMEYNTAYDNLSSTAAQVFRLIRCLRNS